MTSATSAPTSQGAAFVSLPHRRVGAAAAWSERVQAQLAADEEVLAWLEIDLDASLRFAAGLIVVSNARLLAMSSGNESVRSWPYQPGLSLSRSDHAGVGTLELCATEARLAHWHYTLAVDVAAGRLIDHFTRQLHFHLSGSLPAATTQRLCPSCETPLLAGQEQCPVCSKEIHQAPSTWTLLRLGRFARPYRGQLLAGFLLSLLGTAATLVPPYLTMPLMDKVLIPYQNGQLIDPGSGRALSLRPARRRTGRLDPRLGAHLHPGAGLRAHRCRPAYRHLRTLVDALAGVLRRQANRRPDGPYRFGD
jgi:hypothetical protein